MMQLAAIQPALAVNSFTGQMSLSSLLPLIATVYRNIPEAKNRLPDLNVTMAKIITPDIDPVDSENSLPASLVPSEFPAMVRVSDIAEENWPQLIEAESLQNDTDSVRPVFGWANKRILNSFSDDPLLRFLTFIYGAAFYVQDDNGQLSYIIQHNGKLLFISRIEAYLWFSRYSQSFLESLYPEVFGPSLPAGGGWHEWKRFIRKKPFHPDQIVKEPDTASTERAGRQRPINQQTIVAAGGGSSSGDGRLFSGDGRLLQVEYAGEAVGLGLCAVGVKSADTVVLAVEKRPLQLLQSQTNRKIAQIDEHAHLAFAGLSADARALIRKAQLECQSFRLSFEDAMDINCIARRIAEVQQKASQYGGCRPYGVACIVGGFNNDGSPQLWKSEPSGVCSSWKACSVGRKSKAVLELLEREYKDDMSRDDTIKIALKGLLEAVESGASNIELMVLERDHSSRRLALAELEQLETVLSKERDEEAANKCRRDEQ